MTTDILQAIRSLRRSLARAATAAFASSGVGPKQVAVLRELRRAGPLSQVELARSTATDPAGMMRAIDALEGRGWVRRAGSERDRRCKLASLTPQGLLAVRELDATYDALRALADSALTGGQRRQFCAMAARVAAALESASQAAAPPSETPAIRGRVAGRRTESR